MLPSSHQFPINDHLGNVFADTQSLSAAFDVFVSAAGRLETSYALLQQQVSKLQDELAKSHDELRRSLARNEQMREALQHILDSLPSGVVVMQGDRTVKMINPEAERLLGPEGSPGWTSLLAGDFRQEDEKEICLTTPSGKKWLSVKSRTIADVSAAEQQTILILRDTSSHKQLEAEREAARNSLALAELSTMLAHEIRNPLASLELISGLIAEQYTGSPEWMSHLQAGIRSLSATVNNVLRFHNPGVPSHVPLELCSVIRNSVEFVKPIADQKQIALTFIAHGQAEILGDQNTIQQLVMNLACNAIRHTPSGGRITVTAGLDPFTGQAFLEIFDTGCGMSPEYLERIFEPGFSGSGETPGLGLAICDKIVKQHKGKISVLSQVDQGSTFLVEFPCL